MPEISRFFGIVVRIYLLGKEHNPPHVHFIYGGKMAAYDINTFELLDGQLPGPISQLCLQWMAIHKEELLEIWNTQTFKKIKPLE